MKILGTGLAGLVGSRIVELLKDGYDFEISDIDITDRDRIFERIGKSNASVVFHLAAKTSVDGCEKDHSSAWAVNVVGTKNIVDACQKSNKKLIYISTDFVFDGSRPPAGGYKEEDKGNPINWYGKTKYEGEEVVKRSSMPWIITRIAYPYRAKFIREDFVRILIGKFKRKESLQMVTDHIMTPTFVDDVVYALNSLIKNNSTGIFHAVGSEFVSPYEAALKIAKVFGFAENNITKTTRSEFFKNRAPRPFHLALKNDKIRRLGVKMRGFEEGLKELKSQMSNVKSVS